MVKERVDNLFPMMTGTDSKSAICLADKPPRKAGGFCEDEAQIAAIIHALN